MVDLSSIAAAFWHFSLETRKKSSDKQTWIIKFSLTTNNTRIVSMRAATDSQSSARTITEIPFITNAGHVLQHNGTTALSKGGTSTHRYCSSQTELQTKDVCINQVPANAANCAPVSVVEHLHSSCVGVWLWNIRKSSSPVFDCCKVHRKQKFDSRRRPNHDTLRVTPKLLNLCSANISSFQSLWRLKPLLGTNCACPPLLTSISTQKQHLNCCRIMVLLNN